MTLGNFLTYLELRYLICKLGIIIIFQGCTESANWAQRLAQACSQFTSAIITLFCFFLSFNDDHTIPSPFSEGYFEGMGSRKAVQHYDLTNSHCPTLVLSTFENEWKPWNWSFHYLNVTGLLSLHIADLKEEKIVQASPLTHPAPPTPSSTGFPIAVVQSPVFGWVLRVYNLVVSTFPTYRNKCVQTHFFSSLSLHVSPFPRWILICIDLFTSTALHSSQKLGLHSFLIKKRL